MWVRFLLAVLVACVSLNLPAQVKSYPCSKQIEKGQFDKVLKKLNKILEKDPNDCEVNYAVYQYYFAKDNPDYSIRGAYLSLALANELYARVDEKEQAKLRKKGYSFDFFRQQLETVTQAAYDQAQASNTISAYNEFLRDYPLASSALRGKATATRNSLAFTQAVEQNTITAYKTFIAAYPEAAEVRQAQAKIYELAYAEALQENTIAAYRKFIDNYPQAPQVGQAQGKIYSIAYAEATQVNTIDAYQQFINWYPYAPQAKSAQDKIYFMAYAEAEKQGTEDAYRDFAQRYPNSPKRDEALQRAEAVHNADLLATLPSHPDIPTLEQAISSWTGPARDSCLLMLHDIYASSYDITDLRDFYEDYGDEPFLKDLKAHDMAAIEASEESYYDSDAFIRATAPYPSALLALRNGVSSYMASGQWSEAKRIVASYTDVFGNDHAYRDFLRILSEPYDKSIKPVNLGKNINTSDGEYVPVISADGKTLFFTGQYRNDNLGGEDIFVSHMTTKGWGKAQRLQDINTYYGNEGAMALSADGTAMTLFQNGKLCQSVKNRYGWGNPEPLSDNINISNWQCDAMYSSDGKAMLFVANKQTEYEQSESMNIYVSLLDEDGNWGPPIDLGPTINTSLDDRAPFLHPDMKTLYFSSQGHSSIGDFDVFMSTRLSEDSWTEWSEPINLGKEINSLSSDCWYKISTDGKTAYFSKGHGNDADVYSLNMPAHLRPRPVATISGKLRDAHGNPVVTTLRWEDLESREQVGQSHTDPQDGSYFIVLPTGKNYGYYIDDDEYFPVAENIDLRNTDEAVQIEDNVTVATFEQMIEEEIPMPLNNLFFDTGKYDLLPPSIAELQRVIAILQTRKLKVEISGHTDDVGTDADNQILSERRAEAVRNYLVENGIAAELLTTKGYGESRPVATNKTAFGRRKNRRVEIKFVK